VKFTAGREPGVLQASLGQGQVFAGAVERCLAVAGVARETLTDHTGLFCIRRAQGDTRHYFIANRGTNHFEGWLALATEAQSVALMDPLTARAGFAAVQTGADGRPRVFVQLPAGASLVLRTLADRPASSPTWKYWQPGGAAIELAGTWAVEFIQGGPDLPPGFQTSRLASWTELGGDAAQRFAGAARYRLQFDLPAKLTADAWLLDLGKVCQSARVRLNGRELGTLFVPPFSVVVESLKSEGNVLEVDVTNLAANRIRDLDQRKVNWKIMREINFVNINYKPFDAAGWPLTPSGLLGPVTLTPLRAL
jgi:hypothetical protein